MLSVQICYYKDTERTQPKKVLKKVIDKKELKFRSRNCTVRNLKSPIYRNVEQGEFRDIYNDSILRCSESIGEWLTEKLWIWDKKIKE